MARARPSSAPRRRTSSAIAKSVSRKDAASAAARAAKRARSERQTRSSLGTEAYERLKRAIQSGEYGPGDRVLEDEIAERLNISRTPVREALRRLENEGFLVYKSHRGMTVAQLDYQAVAELYAMRYVLESAAAAMAARNASDIELEMLRDLVEQEKAAAASAETMAEHNRRLHLAIYQCAHNRYLLKTMSVLTNPLAILARTAFSSAERRAAVCEEHRKIVEMIRARNPEGAARAAEEHMRAAQRVRLAYFGIGGADAESAL